jgi:NDP-sugar pyrophosphorylase family protein
LSVVGGLATIGEFMKGIVLAGGTGSRLFPLTKITNKHLLPIHDKPMIYYPIQTLVDAGITDLMIVTGGRNSGDFLRLLANGKEFGLKHINYTYQEGEGGSPRRQHNRGLDYGGRSRFSTAGTGRQNPAERSAGRGTFRSG